MLPNPFGGSNSSGGILNKAQQTTSTSTSSSVGAQEGSVAAGERATVNILDAGAIRASIDFAGDALEDVLAALTSTVKSSQSLVMDAVQSSQQQSAEVVSRAVDTLTASSAARNTSESDRVLWIAGVAVTGVIVLVFILGRNKK